MIKSVFYFVLLLLIWLIACDLGEEIDEAIITVSGNVSDDGQPVAEVLVMLVESPDSSDGISLANASITGSTGDYTILNVDPGDYYVMAVDDANDDFEFDVMYDRLGFFGIDPAVNDLEPDAIVVTDEDLENIDIEYLYSLNIAGNIIKITAPD
ncbi:MAG: carboxypeptidase regulatory-like domain-containing protein [Fidelibacterota bacterium]|nr:MAG: carboxypeptidase regulatory-like domain-containing protein [Candidatus Neomarinimicrobiota bacterium]